MNVSLTPKLEEFVRRKVASGLYNNASEVIREALRNLVERETVAAQDRRPVAPTLSELRVALFRLEKPLRDKGITSLALFGSLIRGEAGPKSDIDILIDVDPAAHFSLFDLVSLKGYLEDQLQREVDLVTRDGLDPHVRDQVLYEAESVF